jgi:hypothetical protein
MSFRISLYLLLGKKKPVKRIKIVQPPQQQPKKQKVGEEPKNGNGSHKVEKAEKKPATIKVKGSSIDDGKKMFEWLITPLNLTEFMK